MCGPPTHLLNRKGSGSIKKTQSERSNITSKAGYSSRDRCARSIPLVRGCTTNHAWISARKKSTEHQKIDHQNRIEKLKMTCPKFGCDQWKLASLKHAEGTSTKSGLVFSSGGSLSAEHWQLSWDWRLSEFLTKRLG